MAGINQQRYAATAMTSPTASSRACWPWPAKALLLLALVVLAYWPVLRSARFIWDDPDYVRNNMALRSAQGLADIWTNPHATPQYYPLVHTTFWIEYQLWGLTPVGYHVDNVLIHAGNCILLWWLLRRMGIGGAFLAAAVFAVHPVCQESVAWITERKNVLSLLFYLAAMHAGLRWWGLEALPIADCRLPNGRPWRAYALSFAFFIMALLSKSVTCSLPAAIAVLIWWKHGTIRLRQILLLLPMLAAGAVAAFFTGYLERTQVGASGKDWEWTAWQRCLIAGRALWFYAGKLVWPRPLSFIYPKWDMTAGARLAIFPIGVVAVLLLLWLARRRITRGPLAAALLFCGTLLPALGFINVFPMKYSFVADHFQYHAGIALIVLAAALASRIKPRSVLIAGSLLILTFFFSETWRRGPIYVNKQSLWEATLQTNRASYMVWGNLGDIYAQSAGNRELGMAERARYRQQAIACYQKCLEYGPNEPISHMVWGLVQEWRHDLPAAAAEYNRAIVLWPQYAPAMDSLAKVLQAQGDTPQAIAWYQRCLANDPTFTDAQCDYGELLETLGRNDEALKQYEQAVRLRPYNARAAAKLRRMKILLGQG